MTGLRGTKSDGAKRRAWCAMWSCRGAAMSVLAATLGVAAAPASGQLACRYTVAAVIQAPGGPFGSSPTTANAISPNGRYVVGSFKPGALGLDRGFWYDMQTGQFHVLPFPGSGYQSSYCNDVNDAGLIVGSLWYLTPPAVQRGYVFDINTGQYVAQLMPQPGAAYAVATGINAVGQVCGWRSIGSKGDPVWPWNAFLWSATGGIVDLGVMNGPLSHAFGITDNGTVFGYTGSSAISIGTRGFLWREGQLTVLPPAPGALNSVVRAVLDDEHLVLSAIQVVNGVQRARGFTMYCQTYTNIGVLPGLINTFAWNMDQQGQVLGGCGDPSNNTFAFTWRDGQLTPFNQLVIDATAYLGEAQDVSNAGMIVGQGFKPQGDVVGVVLAPVGNRTGDTNCDRVVNFTDLLNVIGRWGSCDACSADLDGDLDVDVFDLIEVILNWG